MKLRTPTINFTAVTYLTKRTLKESEIPLILPAKETQDLDLPKMPLVNLDRLFSTIQVNIPNFNQQDNLL